MKQLFTPYILIFFFLLKFSTISAQKFQLSAVAKNSKNNITLEETSYLKIHLTEESVFNEVKVIKSQLEKKGYLNVKLDSIYINDSSYTAHFTLSDIIEKIKIYYNSDNLQYKLISKKLLHQISTKITNTYFEIPFTEISNSLQYIVNHYEENGNSFVQVSLKNIHLEKEIAIAQLYVIENKPRTIDKVIVKGYENFPKKFITYDLNLKPKSVFNNDKLASVSAAINSLSFVEEQKPPEVLFTNDSTYIYLYLKKKRSNRFDGVIGFSSKEDSSGLEFNGYLDFLFNNIFNSGESIALLWKNNGNDSQRFFISAETPYIFNLPIIPKATFEIFRQDSTYNNITANFYLSYLLNSKSKITATYSSESSNNLLKTNSPNINVTSYKNNFFGGAYSFRILKNDILFLEKFKFDLFAFFGNRESENIKTNQSKFILNANYLFTINFKNYIFLQNQSAILNSENYFDNELFRIGGVNSIRGFNEESIFASAYSILNLEYRFKPSSSSYFFTISDFALVKNQFSNSNMQIYSLGIGYAFITKIGVLNLSYAVGKFDNKEFNFNNSKLHIKVISIF